MHEGPRLRGVPGGPQQGRGPGVPEDQAPDASFSNKGGHKLESKNILSIMAYLIEDLYDELSNSKKAEEESQADYEAEMDDSQKLWDELDDKRAFLKGEIADDHDDKSKETQTMKSNNK